ncbi:hypothetical protein TeGR_g2044 [Tetraparma gracilis]|uniref:Uncharacterized protein n=1 Tax=Tetraparma gracilis TaxID=2962635 RepID=A0ABQ6MSQ5_9STRA|nr:hypothetical protein TeGR_g2044 [Tetraparma gracilis]
MPMWSRSLQKTTSGHFDLSRDMQTLRQALKDSLTNIGILTAFLCTLGCAAYVEPTAEPKCYGETGLNLVAIILWISMGMFFLAITCTITLALDIDGVPDSLLIPHLEDNLAAHSSPLFLTYAGTFLLATGYGMDLNERVGCPVFPFGLVAAPCFPVVVLGFVAYMRRRRRRLVPLYGAKTGESMWKLGVNFFLPWHDLLVEIRDSINLEMSDRGVGREGSSGEGSEGGGEDGSGVYTRYAAAVVRESST